MTKGKPKTELKRIVQPYRNPWDRRVKGLMEEGKRGPAFYDWWDRIDLCKNVSEDKSKEPPYSNQMPELLLKRIIHITTSPGDLVADPFAGTFSTVKAAIDLGRLGWGCDLNEETKIYHPKSQKISFDSGKTSDLTQNFDIDWMKEPFDISRAGLSPDKFYKSLVANLSIYPEKQRILLLSEIVRLSNYSGEWNTGSITNERIDIMDIFRQIPLSQLDDTLVQLGLKLSEMSRDIKIELLITISTASPKSKAELNIDSQTTLDLDYEVYILAGDHPTMLEDSFLGKGPRVRSNKCSLVWVLSQEVYTMCNGRGIGLSYQSIISRI